MILGCLAVLTFAILYWKVLGPARRPAALLLFGLVLYGTLAASWVLDLMLVLAVALVLRFRNDPLGRGAAIGLALLVLALNKYGALPSFQVVGLSYVAFRLISLCRAVGKHSLDAPPILTALFYALFPPTFLSGPIEPYERLEKWQVPATLSQSELFSSLFRIALGLVKKLLLAAPLGAFAESSFGPALPADALWPGLLAYSLFVYLDFSAYSDLAIGGARLFGYSIGENFDWPYLASNIGDFWKRWHISLSEFLRDHVFIPLSGRALLIRPLARSPLTVGVAASIITMTLCGLWHGDRSSLALWGLGHGVLLAVHQLYRQKVVGRLPARRRMKLLSQPFYRAAATVLTFACVTLLWVPFRFPLSESGIVYGRLFSVLFHSMK